MVNTADGARVIGIVRPDGSVDIGDACTHCGCNTAPGSGAWVNRVPSGYSASVNAPEIIGYLCAECQSERCDECGTLALEWSSTPEGRIVCDDCACPDAFGDVEGLESPAANTDPQSTTERDHHA